MRSNRRWIWIAALIALVILLLPLPIAERYSSPTQDGQYITNPVLAYRFIIAAIFVSPSSELNTSGEALDRAKVLFQDQPVEPTKVELLYLPGEDDYTYTTMTGEVLRVESPDGFVWEVWGVPRSEEADADDASPGTTAGGEDANADVIGLLDYSTGELLASVIPGMVPESVSTP